MSGPQWRSGLIECPLSQIKLRKAGLSITEAINRAPNALLAILPNENDYNNRFEADDDVVVVVARSITRNNVVVRGGQVNVSASVGNCSLNGSVDATMVVMERNLFSWNASTFGQNITTPIIMFSLGSQGFDSCTLQLNPSIPLAFGLTEQPRRRRRALQEDGFGGTQLSDSGADDGRTHNMTMAYHAFDVPAATVVVAIHLSWWDHAATHRMFFRYDSPPTVELHDDMKIVMEEEAVLAWHRGTESSRTWIPNIERRRGKLYVGIQTAGSPSVLHTAPSADDYELRASTVSCNSWEYTSEKWDNTNCGVLLDLSNSAMRCNCSFPRPKAVIGGSVHFPPNSIDFVNIFRNPKSLTDNDNVFYLVIGDWALYLLLMILLNVDLQRLREKMRKGSRSTTPDIKEQLEPLSILPPDRMPALYLYQITFNTGSMFGAGTSARIGFQVFGSECKSAVKTLNPGGESLLRGGTYDFIMPVKNPLGHLELLHIWHDNTGDGDAASWFLRNMIIKDMQTDKVYQFVCYDWLSDNRGDCQVQKVLHVSNHEQLRSFSTMFRENTNALFYDQHMWTSPVVSPEGSSFSKSERLSCCWAVVNSMMVASAMWYRDDNDDSITNIVYNLGFVQLTLQELYVSLVTTALVIPVTMVPLLLFRKEIPVPTTAPGVRRSGAGKRMSRWPKYVAWTIVVVSSIVSSFFVIMYSLDWGREKSEAWLKAFFLSFCLSSVVAETGQIFILALVAALICNPTPSSEQRTYNIKKDELRLYLFDLKCNASRRVYPPAAASGLKMKRKNDQRQKFVFVLKEYSVLLLFVAVLFFISQQDKDPFAFHASQTLSIRLTEDFDSITTPEDFWAWTEGILLPVLYPSYWYNGWKMKYLDRQFPLHTEAFRIGPPRLTQVREAADTVELDNIQNGWVIETGNAPYACWQFNASSEVTHESACVSEYSMQLPTTLTKASSTLYDLQRNQWIDKYTKRLVLELSFYYPSRELGIHQSVDFGYTFWWDEAFKFVLAILVFVNTLKLLRVVRFSKTVAKFIALPGAMKSDLLGFSVTSAVAFMAFSFSGMVVFGTHLKAFSNVLHTNYALLEMLLGRFVAEEILEANQYVGPVYFTLFMICIFIILVNFLVTIICDAIASGASIDNDHDQELVDYIWKSFQQLFGIHSPTTSDVTATTDEEKLTELNANLRAIEESLDDTMDVALSIWPACDATLLDAQDQPVAPSRSSTKPSTEISESVYVAATSSSATALYHVNEQVQNVLQSHEVDSARLAEVQDESRRRAKATLQRKLASRRRKQTGGDERLGTIVESAQELMEQHAEDEARLEHQHRSKRRQFESKLRQKLAARRMQKDNANERK
ncbi:PKD2 [Branchiostoma lanceolatum]|uniref:PKD2 protein n=1 Tax=Branchiostoma lanceolatum TaxID=7740 RepID=A0A8J9VYT9_BRALA|nr:PKD2 [Branchiostoma lanceolatum]